MTTPVQSTSGAPLTMRTANSRPSERRTGFGSTWPLASIVPGPQTWDAMNVKTRSGVTPGLKMSLKVARPEAPIVKLGSRVTVTVSPAFGAAPLLVSNFHGRAIS